MARFVLLVLSAPLVLLGGCNSSSTHPVSGKLTVDGQPAPENTRVTFQPVGETGELASGAVDAQGNYTLYTGSQGEPGAGEGTYKVYVTPDSSGIDYMESGTGPPPDAAGPFPKEWTQPSTTPKQVEVSAGENTIDIDIGS